MEMTQPIRPTQAGERIESLDILRGFAILGILIMNIQSFSMPGAAYLNPMAYGDMTGINEWVWILSHLFGDQKFMTIFSILFGAGVMLFTERAESKTGKSSGLHYRRSFWLLVIGLVHAHLIWYGDILVPYAICALIVYFFRKAKPKTLMITGIAVISVHTIIFLAFGFSMQYWPAESVQEIRESWASPPDAIEAEIAAYTGSYIDQLIVRSGAAMFLETSVFLMIFLWRAGGLMLVGMALYKWGILSAEKSNRYYNRRMWISFLFGFPIVIFGILRNYQAGWTVEYSMFIGSQFNYWGSLFVSFGFICGIMLLSKSEKFRKLQSSLAAVGRTALSNYIFQSVICTFIFYGIGLSLFGQMERWEQVLIMLGVWTIQMIVSPWWTKRFRYGPLEWVWRSLTYIRIQPMRK